MLIIMHGAMTRCVVGTVSIRAAKLKGIEAVSVGSKFVRLPACGLIHSYTEMSGTSILQCQWTYLTVALCCFSLVFIILLVPQDVSAQPFQCGTVGHDLQSSQTKLTDLGFYLNTQNPAPCSGNVTTWEYCYYSPDASLTANEFQVPFGIYRLNGSNYQLVSEIVLINISSSNIGTSPFTCQTFNTSSVTTIQKDDIIGACIHDANTRNSMAARTEAHLNLAGDNADGYSVHTADTSNRRCDKGKNNNEVVTVPASVSESVLTNRNSTILHLFAHIETTTSTEPPTTSTAAETTASTRVATQTESVFTTDTVTGTTTGTEPPITSTATETTASTRVATQTTDDSVTTTSESVFTTDTVTGTVTTTVTESTSESEQTSSQSLTTTTNVKLDATTTTVDLSNTPGVTDTSTSNIGAIIGSLVVILLLISIIIVVLIALFVVVRRKRKESYSIQRGASNINALDNVIYDKFSGKAELEVSAYEVPMSNQQHEYAEATMVSTHTYDDTTFDPYEDVPMINSAVPPLSIYETPLDSPAVSFSALLQKNQREDIYSDLQPFRPPSAQKDGIYEMIRTFGIIDIPRSAIKSVGHLGSGQFANVEEGTWKKGVNKEVRVALKEMHDGSTEEDKIKFLQEAAIMAQFRHPNVIGLYGVVSKGEPVILVTELMDKGDLRNYLNSIRPDPGELPPADLPKLLLIFSQQVALGMQYLAGKGFVHRDLAARNILVSENSICKVSDFGMSRDLADETYYVAHGGKIPVKWTAPEALNYKKYSTASDVWSYGCLLYEIWSIGHKPFEGISNTDAMRLVESGRRLPPPPGCPRMIYQLMILCWNPATSPRPSFRDLVLTLVGNQQLVLSIPQDAIETHQLAGVLGAPLEAGDKMYQDIQNTYVNQDGGTVEELDNDYEEFD